MTNMNQLKKISTQLQSDLSFLESKASEIQTSLEKFNQAIGLLERQDVISNEKVDNLDELLTPAANSTKKALAFIQRGPGRPRKNPVATETETTVVKRGPGRPRKTEKVKSPKVVSKLSTGRGRPSIEEILAEPLTPEVQSEIDRIKDNLESYNQWRDESVDGRDIKVIENGTYLGVIEGFFSSGTSGRYGVTTRVYINPNSYLLPEELKSHIDTAAVNRIRYLETREEGLEYISKQQEKIQKDFFNEIAPRIIKDHGKKGSVYAFHLDPEVRRAFNKFNILYKHKIAPEISERLAKA